MVTNPKIVHCTNDFKGAMRALVQAAMRHRPRRRPIRRTHPGFG
jgi:hypothetical protein